jgi:hypothetical protein
MNPNFKKDELKRAARDALSAGRSTSFKAGATLYLGVCGNQHDLHFMLQECANSRSNMLLRCATIATQNVKSAADIALRRAVLPKDYIESVDAFKKSDQETSFFSPLPRLTASQIYNDLPCFYF